MRLFRNTILFLIFSSLTALAGSLINSAYIEHTLKKETLEFANKAFAKYQEEYDPSKKTIVVFGASTSIYSFDDGDEKIKVYGFADLLKKHVNVMKFTSYSLENVSQVKILLDYLRSGALKVDLIILENFKYLAAPISSSGIYNFNLLKECWMNDDTNMKKLCSRLEWKIGNLHDEYSANPCLKKYQDILGPIYRMDSNAKVKTFDMLLNCGKSSNTFNDVQSYIIENFHYGYAGEVRKSLSHFDINLDPDLQSGLNINNYTESDLIYLNMYLKDFVQNYSLENLMIVPSYSRNYEGMNSLPAIMASNNNISVLEMSEDLLNMGLQKGLNFKANFRDGAHYNNEMLEMIVNKILKKMNLPENP